MASHHCLAGPATRAQLPALAAARPSLRLRPSLRRHLRSSSLRGRCLTHKSHSTMQALEQQRRSPLASPSRAAGDPSGETKVQDGATSSSMVDVVKEGVVAAVDAAVENVSLVGEIREEAVAEAKAGELVDYPTAIKTVGFWLAAAVAFGTVIAFTEGPSKASEFGAGYLLELSLSVDNLFVFVLIFDYFQVPTAYQSRVLSYGIAGAVVCRAILIFVGLSAVQAFEAVNLFFAAVLIFSAVKLLSEDDEEEEDLSNNFIVSSCKRLIPVTDSYDGNKFFTMENNIKKATPLLLTLAVVELTDVFFAFDSIPAIFGVTTDPFIVFTSNIFAILGLRSLFTVIATSMADLRFLQPAIASVLGFIGAKLLADFFGVEISTETSLIVVATLLGGGVFLSLRFPKEEKSDSL